MKSRSTNRGFFSVELLIVLFIAAAFLTSGYQLFTSIMSASEAGPDDIAASNLANDYLEIYRYRAGTPCVEKTILDNLPVQSGFLENAKVSVNITCPIQGISTFLTNGVSSKIESTIEYGDGKATKAVKIVNNKVKIKQISGGYTFMAALGDDGQVYTWGLNNYRQLGINSTATSYYPVMVKTVGTPMEGKKIVKISAGGFHVLALDSDGVLYSWGRNSDGQLGTGDTTTRGVPEKVKIEGSSLQGKEIIDIATTYYSSAAVDKQGAVHTWGSSAYGEQGYNSTTRRTLPGLVTVVGTGMNGVAIKQMSGGFYHFAALGVDGNVYTWGRNNYRQIGDSSIPAANNALLPVRVVKAGSSLNGKTVSQVDCGGNYCITLASDGAIHGWGQNNGGQLGTGNTSTAALPVAVVTTGTAMSGKKINKIVAGGHGYVSRAIDNNGVLYAWGGNSTGAVGDGTTLNVLKPVEVSSANTDLRGVRVVDSAGGNYYSAALGDDGQVYMWGSNTNGELGIGNIGDKSTAQSVSNGARIKKIVNGQFHSAALMSNGDVYTWGRSNYGQMGGGNSTSLRVPTSVAALKGKGVKILESGHNHLIAVTNDNKLYAWGYNNYGQLGGGGTSNSMTPLEIDIAALNGEEILDIAAGSGSTLVLTSGGVYGWGLNTSGQLGNGTTGNATSPVKAQIPVAAGRKIVRIAIGTTTSYAVDSAGDVYSWGAAASGALGNGTTSGNKSIPILISKSGTSMIDNLITKSVVDIKAGTGYALVLASDGTVHGWGLNTSGQLGDGTMASKSKSVLLDAEDKKFSAIFTGTITSAAVDENGLLFVWGGGTNYLLGNGGTTNSSTPTLLIDLATTSPIDQIALSASHALVLDGEKNVYGWGVNTYYNLGVYTNNTPQMLPRAITRIQYDNVW